MVTLQDIANELNVSKSLVSKVLNDRLGTTSVKPEKQELIKATAQRLGYSKNASSVALLKGRHDCIGVFLNFGGTHSSGVAEKFLRGLSDATNKNHKRQSLSFFDTEEDFCELAKGANKGKMDGVLTGDIGLSFMLDTLIDIQRNLPVVTMYNQPIDSSIINVGVNQESVAYMATSHLLEVGCKNIVYLNNHVGNRYEGYQQALRDASVEFDVRRVYLPPPDLTGPAAFSRKTGETAIRYFMDNGIEFDGVVCQSDEEAIGVMHYLLATGRRIPDDVKVIGIDNSPTCDLSIVPLSSIEQHHDTQAYIAADMLFRIIDGEKMDSIVIEPELIVRDSTR